MSDSLIHTSSASGPSDPITNSDDAKTNTSAAATIPESSFQEREDSSASSSSAAAVLELETETDAAPEVSSSLSGTQSTLIQYGNEIENSFPQNIPGGGAAAAVSNMDPSASASSSAAINQPSAAGNGAENDASSLQYHEESASEDSHHSNTSTSTSPHHHHKKIHSLIFLQKKLFHLVDQYTNLQTTLNHHLTIQCHKMPLNLQQQAYQNITQQIHAITQINQKKINTLSYSRDRLFTEIWMLRNRVKVLKSMLLVLEKWFDGEASEEDFDKLADLVKEKLYLVESDGKGNGTAPKPSPSDLNHQDANEGGDVGTTATA